jgi:glycosyltransferase involved in cell wall biosynthesis
MTNPLPGPIAYLTGEYPRATDTFIQREVAALRDLGFVIETCSIRRTGPEHIVGPEQQAEQGRTFHVLPATLGPRGLIAQIKALRHPGRYLKTLALAWKTAPKGVRGRLYNLMYFAESVTLADHLRRRGVVHLHNHIAKASCTVAMLASALTGIPYSFTLHGPDIFFEPYHWRLDAKIERAAFVACISAFCRSQAMLFSDQRHWEKLHIVHCGVDPALYPGRDGPPGQDLLFRRAARGGQRRAGPVRGAGASASHDARPAADPDRRRARTACLGSAG